MKTELSFWVQSVLCLENMCGCGSWGLRFTRCGIEFHSLIFNHHMSSFIMRASKICAAVYSKSPAILKGLLHTFQQVCIKLNFSGALMHIKCFGWKPRWISGTHSKCLITHFKKCINPSCCLYLFTLVVFCGVSRKCFHLLFVVYIDLVIRLEGIEWSFSLSEMTLQKQVS